MNAYPDVPYDALTFVGMIVITLVVAPAAAQVLGARDPARIRAWRIAIAAAMATSAALAASGLLARRDIVPPLMQLLVGTTLIGVTVFAFSAAGRRAAFDLDLGHAVLLQSFRLPLEGLLLHAARQGVMPIEFSMAGYNLDVVTGALALPLGWAMLRGIEPPRGVLLAWNAWGLACLLVIAGLAIATSPNVAAFGTEPAHLSLWVLRFPYVWLPVILVGIALSAHLAIGVRLWRSAGAPSHPTP